MINNTFKISVLIIAIFITHLMFDISRTLKQNSRGRFERSSSDGAILDTQTGKLYMYDNDAESGFILMGVDGKEVRVKKLPEN